MAKYNYAEPIESSCDNCGIHDNKYDNIGFWHEENPSLDGDDCNASKVLCLNCTLKEEPDVENFEELVFESRKDPKIEDRQEKESVTVLVKNAFGVVAHTFQTTWDKHESITSGNPNKAEPGHGGFFEQEHLDGDKAKVRVIKPKEIEVERYSSYWYDFLYENWEGETR